MGQVVGTPSYMSPEQARGEQDRVGPASDIFALGALLYALLTGRAPYSGTHASEIIRQAERAEVTPARQRNLAVPRALEAGCARALAARPEDRYARARDLGEEVRPCLAAEPLQ